VSARHRQSRRELLDVLDSLVGQEVERQIVLFGRDKLTIIEPKGKLPADRRNCASFGSGLFS
jgi:hypothetical protein